MRISFSLILLLTAVAVGYVQMPTVAAAPLANSMNEDPCVASHAFYNSFGTLCGTTVIYVDTEVDGDCVKEMKCKWNDIRAVIDLCPSSITNYDFEGQTGAIDHSNPNVIYYDDDPQKEADCGHNAWLALLLRDSGGGNVGGVAYKLHCEDCAQ